MDIETYITERVDDQLTYYKDSATKAKNIHHRMQTTMILLGILIPVVVNLPHNWGDSIDVSGYIQGTVTLNGFASRWLNWYIQLSQIR